VSVRPRDAEAVVVRASPLDVLRARQWAHFLALPLAAFEGASWPRLALGVAAAAAALAYGYGLNAISDRATDADPRKNPLAGRAGCPPSVAALVGASAALAVAATLALGRGPATAAALSLLASTAYSIGPRWKRLPLAGTALNVAIFAPLLFVAGPAAGAAGARGLALVAAAFVTLLLQNQILHERADAAEDAAAGARTTAVWLGARGSTALSIALGVVGAGVAVLVAPSPAAAAAAIASLTAGTGVAAAGPAVPSARRRAHRIAALAGGALLFAAARLA